MDTGLTVKPTAAATQTGAVRLDAVQTKQSVSTELAAAKAVTATRENAAAPKSAAQPDPFTRDLVIDPQSREVIYRVIDVRSRQVVRQVPDQALLRMRAYTRAIADGDSVTKALSKADLEA